MWYDSITDSSYFWPLAAVSIFALFVIAAGVAHIILGFIIRRLQGRAPTGAATQLVRGMRNSTVLFISLLGLYLSLTSLPDLQEWRSDLTKTWTILAVLILAHALVNTGTAGINWYLQAVAPRTTSGFDDRVFPIFRRLLGIIIYGIAFLIVLDTLGLSISPLLGGLGITGLAVALALQPTLGNFFAGTYVMSDAAIRIGDYIELQGGPTGYVVEVGWRTTKVRTWLNSLVIIPNSVVADTIITNYQAPDPAINILVTCGVSYDSDLAEVERISLEVAREVLELPEAVKEMDPWFGYDSFGDSNIGFWVFVQAKDRIGSFIVTNELIKGLHARFRLEGIEINYPVRKLVYPNEGRPATEAIPGPAPTP